MGAGCSRPRSSALLDAAWRVGGSGPAADDEPLAGRPWYAGARAHRAGRDLRGQAGVVGHQLPVRLERSAAALAVQVREHERRHRLARDASVRAASSAAAIRSSTSRGSRPAVPRTRPAPPSSQCARATAAASSAELDARGHGRAAVRVVEARQGVHAVAERRDAERLQRSAVTSTSRIDFAPDETTTTCVRASSARSAETSSAPLSRGARRRSRPCP